MLRANTEAYDLEMARQSRLAIIDAYESRLHNSDVDGENEQAETQRLAQATERMRLEMAEQEHRLEQLTEARQTIEAALRHGEEEQRALEQQMRCEFIGIGIFYWHIFPNRI